MSEKILNLTKDDLCSKGRDCEEDKCKLAHPKWAKLVCIRSVKGENHEDCGYKPDQHSTWEQLREKANAENHFCHKTNVNLCDFHGEANQEGNVNQNNEEGERAEGFQPIPNWDPDTEEKLKKRKQELIKEKTKQVQHYIKTSQELYIFFIMDCTSSMDPWIEECRNKLISTASFVQEKFQGVLKIGFLGYRDFTDTKKFECIDLTTDVKKVQNFISKVKAKGGYDFAEDVTGALEKALQQQFSQNGMNLIFLITDAPTHGKQYYHQNLAIFLNDYHMEKIPFGSLEQTVRKFKQINKIQFECITLTEHTDIMYRIMKKELPAVNISDKIEASQYFEAVKQSINRTLNRYGQQLGKPQEELKIYEGFTEFKARRLTYRLDQIPTTINTYHEVLKDLFHRTLVQEKFVTINVSNEQVYNQGAESRVFRAYESGYKKLVVKVPVLVPDSNEEKKKKIERKVGIQIITCLLNKLYRQEVCKAKFNSAPLIFYLQPVVYELLDGQVFQDFKYLYAEPEIDIAAVPWERHCQKEIEAKYPLLSAFPHFTFHASNQQLIMDDMQGKNLIFSDPAVHSSANYLNLDPKHEGGTDMGEGGIGLYFQPFAKNGSHPVCNALCQKLGLERIAESEEEIAINQADHTTQAQLWKASQKEEEKSPMMVCDICQIFFQASSQMINSFIQGEVIGDEAMQVLCIECQGLLQNQDLQVKFKCKSCLINFSISKLILKSLQVESVDYCRGCQRFIHFTCNLPNCTKEVYVLSKDAPRDKYGRLAMICKNCEAKPHYLECKQCEKSIQIHKGQNYFLEMIASDNVFCKDCSKLYEEVYQSCKQCKNTQITEMDVQMVHGLPYCVECYLVKADEKTVDPQSEDHTQLITGRMADEEMNSASENEDEK